MKTSHQESSVICPDSSEQPVRLRAPADPRAPLLCFSQHRCLVAKTHSRICWRQGVVFRTEWAHLVCAVQQHGCFSAGSGCPGEQRLRARGPGQRCPRCSTARGSGRLWRGQVRVPLCVPVSAPAKGAEGDAPPGAAGAPLPLSLPGTRSQRTRGVSDTRCLIFVHQLPGRVSSRWPCVTMPGGNKRVIFLVFKGCEANSASLCLAVLIGVLAGSLNCEGLGLQR